MSEMSERPSIKDETKPFLKTEHSTANERPVLRTNVEQSCDIEVSLAAFLICIDCVCGRLM